MNKFWFCDEITYEIGYKNWLRGHFANYTLPELRALKASKRNVSIERTWEIEVLRELITKRIKEAKEGDLVI